MLRINYYLCSILGDYMKRLYLSILSALIFIGCTSRVDVTESNNVDMTEEATQLNLKEWQSDKYGMFIHFGVYSDLGGMWKGAPVPYYSEQIMNHARIPISEYEAAARRFNPQQWDADAVVRLAKEAGMKYIVFTTKHHDGFCMFKTETTDYNIVDFTEFRRDPVEELAEACRRHGIKLGFYYSLPDWHYPGGVPRVDPDPNTNCTQIVNQMYSPLEMVTPALEDYIVAQLTELCSNYGEVETIWIDMGIVTPEQSQRFRKTIKDLQPGCLISGRIMNNQGDYLTLPDNGEVVGYSDLAWDNPASFYGTWGYNSWIKRPEVALQVNRQLSRLMNTISHGGVFLLNIGPKGDGTVLDYEKDILLSMSQWIDKNQEAIYGSEASPFYNLDKGIYCTQNNGKLFFTLTEGQRTVRCHNLITPIVKAYVIDEADTLSVEVRAIEQGVELTLPKALGHTLLPVVIIAEMADEELEILPYYVTPSQGVIRLTEANGMRHAAFDATTYTTTQFDSWRSWNIVIEEDGDYEVFIEYLPEFDSKSYRIQCQGQSSICRLPGVDKMYQTAYAGTMSLRQGSTEFILDQADRKEPLEPLGLSISHILIRKK